MFNVRRVQIADLRSTSPRGIGYNLISRALMGNRIPERCSCYQSDGRWNFFTKATSTMAASISTNMKLETKHRARSMENWNDVSRTWSVDRPLRGELQTLDSRSVELSPTEGRFVFPSDPRRAKVVLQGSMEFLESPAIEEIWVDWLQPIQSWRFSTTTCDQVSSNSFFP